jgi:hypothetical protein
VQARPSSLDARTAVDHGRLRVYDELRDRAFASGVARLGGASQAPLRETARSAHVEARALRGPALRAAIEAVPADVRDHWVEELLDVAYVDLPRDSPYVPSQTADLFHAFDAVRLGPDDCLVDVGSGLGKVVMLASMLTGARAHGVENDPALVGHAREAARALDLPRLSFEENDALAADISAATVFFLYIPFSGQTLGAFLARVRELARLRPLRICASPIDAPWLRPIAPPSSWLSIYETCV